MMQTSNIFLLGAAKSGTTTLAYWLGAHPDVLLAKPKEPVFFEYEYELGLDHYWRKYFSRRWSGEQYLLDCRHRNLFLPFIPSRIRRSLSSPYFLVTLREPVSRAYAHWWHWRASDQEPLSFDEAIAVDQERLEKGIPLTPDLWTRNLNPATGQNPVRTYLDSGFYAEQLRRYIDEFGRDRIFVVFLEEWRRNGPALETIAPFLDLRGIPKELQHLNAGDTRLTYRRGATLARELDRDSLRRALPSPVRMTAKRLFMKPPRSRPPLSEGTRRQLARVYAPHNAELMRLLERQLPPEWCVPSGCT